MLESLTLSVMLSRKAKANFGMCQTEECRREVIKKRLPDVISYPQELEVSSGDSARKCMIWE